MTLWLGRRKKIKEPAYDYDDGFTMNELDDGSTDKTHTAQTDGTVFSTQNNLHANNQQSAATPADTQGVFMPANQPSQSLEIKIVKPEIFDSVIETAQYLVDRHAVVLDIEYLNRETGRRYIDFLSGVLFSIGGEVKKLTAGNYIFTSGKVDVSSYQSKNDPSDGTDKFT